MKTEEFQNYKTQYEKEPVIFFFSVDSLGRDELKTGMAREECLLKSEWAVPLSDFDTDWNDTDETATCIPDIQSTFCYVSMPEK